MDAIGSIAAITNLARLLSDIAKPHIQKLQHSFDEKRAKAKIQYLYSNSYKIYKTRNLINPEKEVDLRDTYVAPSLEYKNTTTSINSSDEFLEKNVILLGLPGHGKSTLLRHLVLEDLSLGIKIPLFCELRKLGQNETLEQFALHSLNLLQFEIDEILFKIFAKNGVFNFYFDAYDEIPTNELPKFTRQIEKLIADYPDCRFIISCRHGYHIEQIPHFETYKLLPLSSDQVKQLIRKVYPSGAEELIKEISMPNKQHLVELIQTPIMTILLAINHAGFKNTPDKISDYYNDLFGYLIRRHDDQKINFHRKRLSALDDHQLKILFSACCYYLLCDFKVLRVSEIFDFIGTVVRKIKIQAAPDKFLSDIQKITGLIFLEGNEYHFIHKSIPEFFAAYFIANQTEGVKSTFYKAMLESRSGPKFFGWSQVLLFLADLDKIYWAKHYQIPSLCTFTGMSDIQFIRTRNQLLKNFINKIELTIDKSSSSIRVIKFPITVSIIYDGLDFPRDLISSIEELLSKYENPFPSNSNKITQSSADNEVIISLSEILDTNPELTEHFDLFLMKLTDKLNTEIKDLIAYVDEREKFDLMSLS